MSYPTVIMGESGAISLARTLTEHHKECPMSKGYKPKPLPSRERLAELFEYDAASGNLIRIAQQGGQLPGTVAGNVVRGYRRASVDSSVYLVHRLVLAIHGVDVPPEMQVDHMNGDRTDNRVENLRVVSNAENRQNLSGAQRTNKAGLLGVGATRHRWRARITAKGSPVDLGCFGTPEEAHAAYLAAKAELHPAAVMSRFAE